MIAPKMTQREAAAKPLEITIDGRGEMARALSMLRVGQSYRVVRVTGSGRPADVASWREAVTLRQIVDDAPATVAKEAPDDQP